VRNADRARACVTGECSVFFFPFSSHSGPRSRLVTYLTRPPAARPPAPLSLSLSHVLSPCLSISPSLFLSTTHLTIPLFPSAYPVYRAQTKYKSRPVVLSFNKNQKVRKVNALRVVLYNIIYIYHVLYDCVRRETVPRIIS